MILSALRALGIGWPGWPKLYNHWTYEKREPVSRWAWLRFAIRKPPLWWEDGCIVWGRYAHCGVAGDIRYAYFLQIIPHRTTIGNRYIGWGWFFYDHPFTLFNLWWLQWAAYTEWTPWKEPDSNDIPFA